MSLDMTIGTRVAETYAEGSAAAVPTDAATQAAHRKLVRELLVIAGASFAVVLASALAVLLFLR